MQVASIRAPLRVGWYGSGCLGPTVSYPISTITFHQHVRQTKHYAQLSSLTLSRSSRSPRCSSRPSLGPNIWSVSSRANSSAPKPLPDGAAPLDWNSFFKLRASRRRYSLGSSILASAGTMIFGVQYLATQDLEALGVQVMGLDPFVVLGLATASCGAVGWLLGPFVGNAVWGLFYRRYKTAVAIKEKEFFNRIKRFRVDPSSTSIANPVPDYYGEKIGSVQGYRHWLKDQRAFNRKRRNFIS